MKSEMDVMNMDERQRMAWLMANRATLIIVGVLWLGVIGLELLRGRTPIVMIVLVPVIALVRFIFYRRYVGAGRRPLRTPPRR